MAAPARPKKKRGEKAWIETEFCSGCEACVDICPVDCIAVTSREPSAPFYNDKVCIIEVERCTGCRLCYDVCPWDCIVMVDQEEIEQALPLVKTVSTPSSE